MVRLSYSVEKNRIIISADKSNYEIEYEQDVLHSFGEDNSKRIAENLLYLLTLPKALQNNLVYGQRPYFEDIVMYGIYKDLPIVAEEAGRKTSSLITSFNNMRTIFEKDQKLNLSLEVSGNPNNTILGMSFGKDSLLSYGIAKELGIDIKLVFFNDIEEVDNIEFKHKMGIINKFTKKLKEKVIVVRDNTDQLFNQGSDLYHEFIRTNAMLSYTLEIMPLAFSNGVKYVMWGNEQNFNDSFINKDGHKAYPSFDQTSEYMQLSNKNLEGFGGGFRVISLIEPIYNLAEYKILKNRYSNLLPFLMSCNGNKSGVWCYKCPMCAKTFIYSLATGLKPSRLGFNANFLNKEFKRFYPLFSKPKRAYEKPRAVRDEQLYAFYLIYKKGLKGDLISNFKDKFLEEAKEREDELYKKFFGIHKSFSIPAKIKKEVVSIYREELNNEL